MKKVIMMLASIVLAASQNMIAQNDMKLSNKQQALVAIAPDFGNAPPNIIFEPNCHRKVA